MRHRFVLAAPSWVVVVLAVGCDGKPPAPSSPDEALPGTGTPGAASHAEPTAPEHKRAKIMGYAWSKARGVTFDAIVPFCWLTLKNLDAVAVKAATDGQPDGHRCIFSWDVHRGINAHPDDVCLDASGTPTKQRGIWWDNGVADVAMKFDAFFGEYKQAGGKLDVFVLDFEGGLSNWHLGKSPELWAAIAADKRFADVAAKLGFSDMTTVREWYKQQGPARENYLIWNALMAERVAAYVGKAVYDPIRKHYPDVVMSNYGDCYHSAECPVPDVNGHRIYAHGTGAHVGTHQSMALYAEMGQIERLKLDGTKPYARSAFNAFRLSLNCMLSMASSSDVPTHPWISHKAYEGSLIRESDLYQELVYHTILAGADAVLYWNPRMWKKGQDPSKYADIAQDGLMNDLLREANALVGFEGRRTLADGIAPWNAAYALTGMAAGGRTVWRFTPEPAQDRKLKVDRGPATFTVDDVRIQIPGGTILEVDRPTSRLGWWVVAPIDARPVVTEIGGEG